ncbi:CpsD/CapB family tyrosine-protein kinase [Sphingomonas quercus]|uniref:CpsD/CapB family tyrosine-protein kinase n=1 Tax=Sphingomonas quercus TaxID=2842451 RepID=A0ABS6BJ16_9SPHN|nr:CpsD/CapB family tyrosine-protein kinase [Sphingomonas quercus]MBU3077185.1 CpsD/CapB family tyrosine-protein kinase [Sphingomonas quercus]
MPIVSDENNVRAHGGQDILALHSPPLQLNVDDWGRLGIFGFNSRDRRSRAFNLLRSQVMKIAATNGWRTIGVTSPTPRVGKSFIASNLAASLSRIPTLQTYLFDLDLRRGSIAEAYGIERGIGLNAFLSGETDTLEGSRYVVPNANLNIFPCFVTNEPSAEMLAGTRMTALSNAMKALPGQAISICDLPPVFANDDASLIVRQVDAYLLVVEEGRTTARQVRDAMDMLAPEPCIGTVLNRYRGGIGGDDYGFGYGRQSHYGTYYS